LSIKEVGSIAVSAEVPRFEPRYGEKFLTSETKKNEEKRNENENILKKQRKKIQYKTFQNLLIRRNGSCQELLERTKIKILKYLTKSNLAGPLIGDESQICLFGVCLLIT